MLEPLQNGKDVARLTLERFHRHLAPVYETVGRIKGALPPETALIGFAGAPWTVASYMIEGGSSRDFTRAKRWMHGQITEFAALIDLLVDATSQYLIRQVEAGAAEVSASAAGPAGAARRAADSRSAAGADTDSPRSLRSCRRAGR